MAYRSHEWTGGARRTLDEDALQAERQRLRAQPPSPERSKALRLIGKQLERISARSPWRD